MSMLAPVPSAVSDRSSALPGAKPRRRLHVVVTTTSSPRQITPEIPPPPETAIQKLALYAFEAVEGIRQVAALGRTISPSVIEELQAQRHARIEQRSLHKDSRRVVATPGPAHLSRVSDQKIEGVVVLQAAPRATAVTFTLEFSRARWQATQLTVL